MADLVVRIRGDVDDSELKGFSGTNEELAKKIKSVEAAADDLSGKTIALNINTTVKGSGQIKDVIEVTETLDAETAKLTKTIGKLTNAEKGSLSSSRALVANLTQQRNAIRTGSFEWGQLSKQLADATREYNASRGIQEGSITQLRQQNALLKETRDNTNLTGQGFQAYSDAIRANESRIRRLQGVQKDSLTDLQAQRKGLLELLNATNKSTDTSRWESLRSELSNVEGKISALEPASKKFIAVLDNIQRVRATVETVAQAFAVLNSTINTFVGRQKQVEGLALTLSSVGLSAREVANAFASAESTATSLGAPLQAVERSYRRMVPSLSALGFSANETDEFIKQLSARTQTLGLNTEESGRFIEAFAQVLSKGRLSGEELNQQISELDGGFRSQLAEAIGISTIELNRFVEAGNISATETVKAFVKMRNGAEALEEGLKNNTATIQQLQNSIATINTKTIENIGEAFQPLFRSILNVQIAFATFVNQLSKTQALNELATAIGSLIEGITLVSRTIIKAISAITPFIDVLATTAISLLNLRILGISVAKGLGVLAAALIGLLVGKAVSASINLITASIKGLAATQGAVKAVQLLSGALSTLVAGDFVKSIASFQVFAKLIRTSFVSALLKGGKAVIFFGKALLSLALNPVVLAITAAVVVLKKLQDGFDEGKKAAATYTSAINKAQKALEDFYAAQQPPEPASAVPAAGPIEKYADSLQDTAEILRANGGFLNEFAALGNDVFSGLARGISNVNKIFAGFTANRIFIESTDAGRRLKDEIGELATTASRFGGVLTQNSNVSKLNNKELLAQKSLIGGIIAARRSEVNALEETIEKLKKANSPNLEQIKLKQQELDATKALLAAQEPLLANLDEEFKKRVLQGEAIGSVSDRLSVFAKNLTDVQAASERANAVIEADSYQALASGIASAEEAETSRTTAQFIGISKTIEAQKLYLQELQKQKNTEKGLSQDQQERYDELSNNIRTNAVEQARLYSSIKDSIVDAFENGINTVQRFTDIAKQSASAIKGVFDSISGSAVGGIQQAIGLVSTVSSALQEQVDRSTQRRIQLLEKSGLRQVTIEQEKLRIQQQGDNQKRQILATELATKSRLIDTEIQIERIRNKVSTQTAIAEARVAQLRLAAEAQIAQARGENDLAQALLSAARAQSIVIRGLQIEGDLNDRILSLRRDQEKAAIGAQAAAAGISGFTYPNLNQAITDANAFAKIAEKATNELAGSSQAASNLTVDLEKVSLEKGAQEAQRMRDFISNAAEATSVFASDTYDTAVNIGAAASNAGILYNNLRRIAGLGSGNGAPARAMGGPVTAGQQYMVNDGGGREGFLSRSGAFSMLPAGRNMNWVAPTSGHVIPAHLIDDVKRQIAMRNSSQYMGSSPRSSAVSGNLITHASTRNLSSNSTSQRIVNHVTIQSQEPVMDASRLMVQASRIKSRRRL